MQSDVELAELVAFLRAVKSFKAADRLESQARDLAEAIRERDELRAAVKAVRGETGALDTYCATDEDFPGYSQGLSEVYAILDKHIPQTEGSKQ